MNLSVDVQVTAAPDSVLGALPDAATLIAMLEIDPVTSATPNEPHNVAWTFDSEDHAFDYLAQGETLELTYTVLADDTHGGTATQTITITINGTNDAPVIEVLDGNGVDVPADSVLGELTETDAGLEVSGTLTVTDLDLSDTVSFTTTDVEVDTTNEDVLAWLPSEADLIAMMTTNPGEGLEANPGDEHNVTWTFNSNVEAFNYLAEGETLTLTYTIEAKDSSLDGATTTQEVTITVLGTNDAPVITVEEGDSVAETLTETNDELVVDGTITISDIDLSDDVNLSVDVQVTAVT